MIHGDTIAAISTPPGRGGIGIVRLSGPASLEIVAALFRSRNAHALDSPRRVYYGQIVNAATKETVDSAILTHFRAPRSYTGEDVAELSCHGSPVVLAKVLGLVTSLGARIAEPGEFTLRAFFHGRMDLAQAQAVRDLIEAQTEFQARIATRQIEGGLAKRLAPVKETLVHVVVHLESSLEFVEEDISPEESSRLLGALAGALKDLDAVASSFSFGRYVREGFNLAIVGRPNVGKSSVFNRLLGQERAIVTDIPGTTRDTLQEPTSILGVPVRLIDTAGIRKTRDAVETIGIDRSRTAIAEADVSLLVLDQSEPLEDNDQELLSVIPGSQRILLLNKCDLPCRIGAKLAEIEAIRVSALTGEGFDNLGQRICDRLAIRGAQEREDTLVTDARQEAALRRTMAMVAEACRLLSSGEPEEVVSLKLHSALEALGEITGETLTEDILAEIFSTFCIGK
jgi:tRNA modification GTPase